MRRRTFIHGSAAALFVGCSADSSTGDSPDAGAGSGSDAALDAGADAGLADAGAEPDATSDAVSDTHEVADAGQPPECEDPFAGGELLGTLAWVDEGDKPFGVKVNDGWDGRLYTDLSQLTPDNLNTATDDFYIRTHAPPSLDLSGDWSIAVSGLVEPATLLVSDLLERVVPMGPLLMECSGNGPNSRFGLLSSCEWSGVPVSEVLDLLTIDSTATRVLINGFDEQVVPSTHSTPGAAWIFTIEQLTAAGAFFATHMNGEPLTPDHGAPIRLMVPNWYGCTCIKWVDAIQLVDDTEPATSQMKEFAGRTHQSAIHALAKDYLPATMDQAAMPIRIEQWRVNGALTYRVVGILWGGYAVTDALEVRFGAAGDYVPVDVCPDHAVNTTWTLWSHQWTPDGPGDVLVHCRIADSAVPTRRLDTGFYDRIIRVPSS